MPDLYVLGKALGGGIVALSAIAGDDDVLGVFAPGCARLDVRRQPARLRGRPRGARAAAPPASRRPTRRASARGCARGIDAAAPPALRAIRSRGLWFGLDVAREPRQRARRLRAAARRRACWRRTRTSRRPARAAADDHRRRGRLAARAPARRCSPTRRSRCGSRRAADSRPRTPRRSPASFCRHRRHRPPHRRRAARGRPAEPRRARRAREPVLARGQAARRPAARDAASSPASPRSSTPAALGQRTEAFVEIHCAANMSPIALRETLAGEPEVVAAYTVTGDADALVQVRATDVAHLEAAVERIRTNPGIARTKTIIVLSRLIARGEPYARTDFAVAWLSTQAVARWPDAADGSRERASFTGRWTPCRPAVPALRGAIAGVPRRRPASASRCCRRVSSRSRRPSRTRSCTPTSTRRSPARWRCDATFEGDSLLVEVSDDGCGMMPRLDSPGLGVGLPFIADTADTLDIGDAPRGGTRAADVVSPRAWRG